MLMHMNAPHNSENKGNELNDRYYFTFCYVKFTLFFKNILKL